MPGAHPCDRDSILFQVAIKFMRGVFTHDEDWKKISRVILQITFNLMFVNLNK
jgi:hypothetical protein